MNLTLAKEIYNSTWHIEHGSVNSYIQILEKSKDFVGDSIKSNAFAFLDLKSKTLSESVSVVDSERIRNTPENKVAVYFLDSVITKSGGMSHNGTVDIANQFSINEKNDTVIGHIFVVSSPGGTTVAVDYLTDEISKAKKPVVGFGEDMVTSAALWISSYFDYMFMRKEHDIVGSVGTMISFSGLPSKSEDKVTGEKSFVLYATKSTEKNKEFNEAINNDNVKLIIDNILDPTNERFISSMKENKPNSKEEHLTGKVFKANEVLGIFIDQIGSFEDAIEKVVELSSIGKKHDEDEKHKEEKQSINNQINTTMTKGELLQNDPSLCNELVQEGVLKERARVSALMAWSFADPSAVTEAISAGTECDAQFAMLMNQKAVKTTQLKNLESDSAEDLGKKENIEQKSELQSAIDDWSKKSK